MAAIMDGTRTYMPSSTPTSSSNPVSASSRVVIVRGATTAGTREIGWPLGLAVAVRSSEYRPAAECRREHDWFRAELPLR
jgi:hypothetical protein